MGKRNTKNAYGRSVILSSAGMHDMGRNIVSILEDTNGSFAHLEMECDTFANGEMKPWIPETVRGEHVFVLQALQEPDPNIALMQLLLTADALKRASVAGITMVLPYIPYLRQDRKDMPRVPISARLIADLIESNEKVERVITMDMHVDQEQGFFSIPVDNIRVAKIHAEYFKNMLGKKIRDVVVVSPDVGGASRARRFAQFIGEETKVALIDKRRTGRNKSEVLHFIGESLKGKIAIIFDDMIDTGGTNRGAAQAVMEQGAEEAYTCVTHGIFSKDAEEEFAKAGKPVVISSTIPRSKKYRKRNKSWLTVVPIDELLAEAIHQASLVGGSVSKLS